MLRQQRELIQPAAAAVGVIQPNLDQPQHLAPLAREQLARGRVSSSRNSSSSSSSSIHSRRGRSTAQPEADQQMVLGWVAPQTTRSNSSNGSMMWIIKTSIRTVSSMLSMGITAIIHLPQGRMIPTAQHSTPVCGRNPCLPGFYGVMSAIQCTQIPTATLLTPQTLRRLRMKPQRVRPETLRGPEVRCRASLRPLCIFLSDYSHSVIPVSP